MSFLREALFCLEHSLKRATSSLYSGKQGLSRWLKKAQNIIGLNTQVSTVESIEQEVCWKGNMAKKQNRLAIVQAAWAGSGCLEKEKINGAILLCFYLIFF